MERDWLRIAQQAENEQDYRRAFKFYRRAAEAGDIEGWIGVANMYDDHFPNPEKARKAWIIVHEDDLAHGDKSAYWYLGLYYCEEGRHEEGIDYLKRAAVDGNEYQLEAEIALGNVYYEGKFAAQDFGKALEWYRKAEAHGSAIVRGKIEKCERTLREENFRKSPGS